MQYQALVVETQQTGRWHVVDVPLEQPGVTAVVRDILLVVSQHVQEGEAVPVVIYEVSPRENEQYGRFQVCQGYRQWSIGLYDEDGPYYTVLSAGGEHHAFML